jgi:hypothetical protein
MGYLDELGSTLVKTTADGRKVYSPWGSFGRTYEIATRAHQRAVGWTIVSQIALFAVAVFSFAIAGWYAVPVVPAVLAAFVLIVRRMTRDMKPSATGISADEEMEDAARKFGAFGIWTMLAFTLFFTGWAILQFFAGADPLYAGAMILIGLCGTFYGSHLLWTLARLKRREAAQREHRPD